MSRLAWPARKPLKNVRISSAERPTCELCDGRSIICGTNYRRVHSTCGSIRVTVERYRCPTFHCPNHQRRWAPTEELLFAPRGSCVSWDLLVWIGYRRFARHWSVPQLRAEIIDSFDVELSADLIEDTIRKYQTLVAAREADLDRLRDAYRDTPDLVLSIDGLQPEKGHETLYVVREVGQARILFAEPLLSSTTSEILRLFEKAKSVVDALGKPVRAWVSDKQKAFVTCVAQLFPGVPHRYCANHFLRDLAKPILEKDSRAKVTMRRKVRGLRAIEKELLETSSVPAGAGVGLEGENPVGALVDEAVSDTPEQVVLGYASAVRGILNGGQGGPLQPPGVRMADALQEVRDSVERSLMEKKGGSASGR
jgi:hypothetical protein